MQMFKKLTPSWRDDAEGKMHAAADAIYDLLAEVKHLRVENESLKAELSAIRAAGSGANGDPSGSGAAGVRG